MATVYDSVYTYLVPCLCDVLSGFGLCALLEFSRTSPGMHYFLAICIGVVLALGVLQFFLPYKRVPAWLALCNTTYSLVVTLSLSLNLLLTLLSHQVRITGNKLRRFQVSPSHVVERSHVASYAARVRCGGVLALAHR